MRDLLLSNVARLELPGFTQGVCPGKYMNPDSKMTFEPTHYKILNK